MGWEHRKRTNKAYYYKSIRTPSGVKKRYLGNGEAAEVECQRIEAKRKRRDASAQAITEESQLTSAARVLTEELDDLSELALETALFSAGYWRGTDYRKWRKRRGGQG